MLADELRSAFLTSGLSDEQLAGLLGAGQERSFVTGDELFREGEPADYLWVLLEGRIELSRKSGAERIVLATMSTPGQWAGGLRAWDDSHGSASYRATGHAASEGRAFCVPSADLGRLVEEWFSFGKHMIVGVYQTVRGIEAMARQREALVALGTLAAGLAHEINNPAAASLRAVEALRQTCDAMLSSLSGLAEHAIGAERFIELDRLRQQLLGRCAPTAGAVATMEREEIIGHWLERRHVARPWELAPVFAAAGADHAWLEEIETLVGPAPLSPALSWISTTLNATALLSELTDTTNRISHLVDAVKSYSQMDRASRQRVDIHEGIDSTLAMLGAKLEDVIVKCDFDPEVPSIDAFPAELNQVWTNIIDNAVDAMDGRGTLLVTTRSNGKEVIVDITDSGHGMAAEVQARAFEPFFTTKDVGKGTGLGLDISRRVVVERHGGDITFDSKPGATTVRVRLPLTR